MNKHGKFQTAASLGAGLLLLSTALTAWGVSIILTGDAGGTVSCTTSLVTVTDGNVTAEVPTACIPTGDGGGSPPPADSFTLSVSKDGTGSGTVTSDPLGINCGTDCSQAYTDGTSVSLTPDPASGSTFDGWGGACDGTGACTLGMTANRSVTATFTAEGGGGDCGPLPADVTVVDTGNLDAAWPTVEFTPAPTTVMAFRVNVPSNFSGRGSFRATKLPPATAGKAIVVSSCPGSVQPVAATACTLENVTDSALVRLSADSSDNQFIYCKLSPGQTYYINAFSKRLLSDTGFNCSSTSTCKFQAFRGQPF